MAKNKSVYCNDEGESITEGADISEAYRDAADDLFKITLGLSDEQIVAIVKSVPGDETDEKTGGDVRMARLEALKDADGRETLADLTKPPSAISSELGILAANAGAKIDAETDNIVDNAVDAKEIHDGAPLEIADHFCKLYGGVFDDDGDPVRCPEIDKWPVPGTNQKNLPAGSNIPCDRYKWTDHATGTEYPGHFMGDLHDGTPHGQELKARQAALKLLKDAPQTSNIGFGYATKLFTDGVLDEVKWKTEQSKIAGRRSSRINRMGRAVKFLQTISRIHSELTGVGYVFVHDDRADRYRSNKPIKLTSGSGKKSVNVGPYGLSQIIGLKITEAVKNGGTLAALTATMKRKKKTDEKTQQGGGKDGEGVNQRLILNANQVEMAMAAVVTSFSEEGGERLLSSIMLSLGDASLEGKERVKTFCEASDKLAEIAARVRPLYNAILQEQSDAEAKAIAAKLGVDPKTGLKVKAA